MIFSHLLSDSSLELAGATYGFLTPGAIIRFVSKVEAGIFKPENKMLTHSDREFTRCAIQCIFCTRYLVKNKNRREAALNYFAASMVFIHVLFSIIWLGGMFFIALVLLPSLRKLESPETRTNILSNSARRFRIVSWVAVPIIVITGIVNAVNRGVSLHSISSGELFSSTFGKILLIKVSLVIIIIFLSILHDFILGPRLVESMKLSRQSFNRISSIQRKKELVSWMARLNLLLGIMVVFCAVMLS